MISKYIDDTLKQFAAIKCETITRKIVPLNNSFKCCTIGILDEEVSTSNKQHQPIIITKMRRQHTLDKKLMDFIEVSLRVYNLQNWAVHG